MYGKEGAMKRKFLYLVDLLVRTALVLGGANTALAEDFYAGKTIWPVSQTLVQEF
jgi:hypothetical protein